MKRTFKDQVVLITGGSRGLGLELTKRCLQRGAIVAICARHQTGLKAALKELGASGRTSGHVADIGSEAATNRLVKEVIAKWGRLDLLINNASEFIGGPMNKTMPADYKHMLRTNTLGTIALTEAALPHLRANGGGGVITIATAAAILPAPHLPSYSVSKAAVQHYMQLLELEQAGPDLTTLTVYPSYMSTNFLAHTQYRGDAKHEGAKIGGLLRTPLISTTPQAGADRIVRAWLRGRRVLIYPWTARLGAAMRWLMPHTVMRLARWATRRYFG